MHPFAEARATIAGWTFAGSDEGGRRAAAIYTLIVSAKLNGVDPQTWLADVLARLHDHAAKRITERDFLICFGGGLTTGQRIGRDRPSLSRRNPPASSCAITAGRCSLMFISRTRLGGDRWQSLWGLSRRTRAIDHLLYESNSGFWRWVTGGCGNVLSISVVVIASTRPPPKRLLGLGQP